MIFVMHALKVVILSVVINVHQASICSASKYKTNTIKQKTVFIYIYSDPPLEESDIPTGEWLCHSCKYASSANKQISPQTRNKRSSSTPPMNSVAAAAAASGSSSGRPAKKAKLNPMEVLVQAASALNPKQFELPRSMSVPCMFPGRDKSKKFCCGNNDFSVIFSIVLMDFKF